MNTNNSENNLCHIYTCLLPPHQLSTSEAYLGFSLLMSVCGLTQLVPGLGQVSVSLSQLFAGLVQLCLQLLQLGSLVSNILLMSGQIPLQL